MLWGHSTNNKKVLFAVFATLFVVGAIFLFYPIRYGKEMGRCQNGNGDCANPINVAAELADCLPKSDMASKEKCDRLIAGINNFSECVNAGFSILKSNPPQCMTPDGRTFMDNTGDSWLMIVDAIRNCEVERIFQAHSLEVAARLKKGVELYAIEPQIDDIMKIAEEAEPKCGRIILSTE